MGVFDVGKAAVRIFEIELHSAGSLQNHALRDLKFFVLHPIGHLYDDFLFIARRGDFQRRNLGFQKSRHTDASRALLFIEFPGDRDKLRFVYGRNNGGQNLKPGIARFSAEDRE